MPAATAVNKVVFQAIFGCTLQRIQGLVFPDRDVYLVAMCRPARDLCANDEEGVIGGCFGPFHLALPIIAQSQIPSGTSRMWLRRLAETLWRKRSDGSSWPGEKEAMSALLLVFVAP